MALRELQEDAEFHESKAQHPLVLAYLSTPTCNVCKVLRPKVEALLDERQVPGVYVDTTTLPAVAGQLLVFAVPTIILFAEGREFARLSRHLSMGQLEAEIARAQRLMAD